MCLAPFGNFFKSKNLFFPYTYAYTYPLYAVRSTQVRNLQLSLSFPTHGTELVQSNPRFFPGKFKRGTSEIEM